MNNQKIIVDVMHENLLENTKVENKNCVGSRIGDTIFRYKEDAETEVTLIVQDNRLMIERNAENKTRIVCCPDRKETAVMMTEFGEFQFIVETDYIKKSSRMISVQYTLSQGDLLINKAHIRWIIKEEQA